MTQATMARPDAPRRTFPPIALVALFVVGALLFALMIYAVRDPDVVAHVTVENPSTLLVDVSVHPAGDDARLLLAPAAPEGRTTTSDVLDQGDEWVFTFSSGGVDGGSLRVPREKLAADHWRVVIPDSVLNRLQSGTFEPAYR